MSLIWADWRTPPGERKYNCPFLANFTVWCYAQARSLLSSGVRPSVTFLYCIQTTEDIVRFQPCHCIFTNASCDLSVTAEFLVTGGSGSAHTRIFPFWISLEVRMREAVSGVNWSYKTFKAPVKWSPPTNQPSFLPAGCPSCRPANSVGTLKGINRTVATVHKRYAGIQH